MLPGRQNLREGSDAVELAPRCDNGSSPRRDHSSGACVPGRGKLQPRSTPDCSLRRGRDSKAIFAYANAGDTSELTLTGFSGNPIFNNSVNSAGDTVDLGALSGLQQFGLHNQSTSTTFLANVADAAGDYHAFHTTNFADFSVGPLPAATVLAIAAAGATTVTFVGWEDRTGAGFGL